MNEQIKSGSKLLAEFEGYNTREGESGKLYRLSKKVKFGTTWEEPAYHTDYNELHRVWRKFRTLGTSEIFADRSHYLGYVGRKMNIATLIAEESIEVVFNELVEGVKYLNSLKPKS